MSATRPDLSTEQLATIVSIACADDDLAGSTVLSGGTYNAVYRLDLASGRSVVVKIAPSPDAPRLSYELDLLRTEALFYEQVGDITSAPLPKVVHAGFDRNAIDSDFLVLSVVEGIPWLEAGSLDDELRRPLRRDLGRILAELHGVGGDQFGYPQEATGRLTDRWSDAFIDMVEAVLRDADEHDIVLPVGAAEVRACLARQVDTLDEVVTPTFIHFDLWDGNLFIDPREARVTGIIDAERAFYGDPVADFVSLPLFGDPEADTDMLDSYRAAGGPVEFTPSVRARLAMYRMYMDLLLLVEAGPRGQKREEGMRRFFEQHLREQIAAL